MAIVPYLRVLYLIFWNFNTEQMCGHLFSSFDIFCLSSAYHYHIFFYIEHVKLPDLWKSGLSLHSSLNFRSFVSYRHMYLFLSPHKLLALKFHIIFSGQLFNSNDSPMWTCTSMISTNGWKKECAKFCQIFIHCMYEYWCTNAIKQINEV